MRSGEQGRWGSKSHLHACCFTVEAIDWVQCKWTFYLISWSILICIYIMHIHCLSIFLECLLFLAFFLFDCRELFLGFISFSMVLWPLLVQRLQVRRRSYNLVENQQAVCKLLFSTKTTSHDTFQANAVFKRFSFSSNFFCVNNNRSSYFPFVLKINKITNLKPRNGCFFAIDDVCV